MMFPHPEKLYEEIWKNKSLGNKKDEEVLHVGGKQLLPREEKKDMN